MELFEDVGEEQLKRQLKTDLVRRDDLNSKIKHYKPQAKVYSDAIKTIFGQPPKEVILVFLHLMEPVSLKLSSE